MALSITPTVNPTTKAVSLLVAGGTPPYVVTASPVGAPDYVLRGGWSGVGASLTTVDGEVRLNVPTQYSATDAASGSATTSPVTVASTTDVLSDSLDPTRALPVVVQSQDGFEREARTTVWDVLGRDDPAVSTGPMRYPAGDLVLRVAPDDRAALVDLIASGQPLLLRSVSPDAVDDMHIAVRRLRTDLALPEAPAGTRVLTLEVQAITRDLGAYVPSTTRTYTLLTAEASSYTDVLVRFATYDDVRTGRQR